MFQARKNGKYSTATVIVIVIIIVENLDSTVNNFIRKWLDVPISGTLSNVFLECNKFGLNVCPPSVKFVQCQTVIRTTMKTSRNHSIGDLWKSSSCHTNIQYDTYKSTKDVLKDFRSSQEDKLQHTLTSQGFFFTCVAKYSLKSVNSLWSAVQSKLPKNIFNFTIRYINNTLPTRKNMLKWGVTSSPDCSFCLNPESLLHVVAGCQHYLDRFTWRHDSVVNFIATSLQPIINGRSSLYADIIGYPSPSVITGDSYRPDLVIHHFESNDCLYVIELTVGFESNLKSNITRKREKYKDLIHNLNNDYKSVKFVNLSLGSLGVFSSDSSSFQDMMNEMKIDIKQQRYIIKKIMNIAIRSTYYIFCCRNKSWDNPDLLKL